MHLSLAVRRLGDGHPRRPGKHNGDVPEPDVRARVLEHQPGRAGREIRRHVQANRRQVRAGDTDNAISRVMNGARDGATRT